MKCSVALPLFSSSAFKVHDSQAYRKYGNDKGAISFTFDPRDMLLSLQIGFSFVRAAVVCSTLERISGWAIVLDTNMFEACYSSRLLSCHFDLLLDAISTVYHLFGLFSTGLHHIPCAGFVEAFTRASSSCFSSARASVSMANHKWVIFLPLVPTFPSCSSRASVIMTQERCWRGWVREGILALLRLLFWTLLLCCCSSELHL